MSSEKSGSGGSSTPHAVRLEVTKSIDGVCAVSIDGRRVLTGVDASEAMRRLLKVEQQRDEAREERDAMRVFLDSIGQLNAYDTRWRNGQ